MDRVKRIWYLSPMRAAKVQASLRIRAVSPEPSLLAHTSSESRGTFRQKARSLAPLNGWACAVKICHDGMLEDTNSLDGAQKRQINVLHEPDFSSDSESETIPLFIASVGKQENSYWYADMLINNQVVNLKLNSGAQCNVLPYSLFKKVGGKQTVNSNVRKLVTFTGEKIKMVGRAMLDCEYKDRFHVLEFQIVDHDVIPMLGLQTCQEHNMIQKIESVNSATCSSSKEQVSSGLSVSNMLAEFSIYFMVLES